MAPYSPITGPMSQRGVEPTLPGSPVYTRRGPDRYCAAIAVPPSLPVPPESHRVNVRAGRGTGRPAWWWWRRLA